MRKSGHFPITRMAFDGILVALFFVLTLFSVEIAGVKITFDSLAVVIAAVLFGPVDALVVGLLGALLEQLLKYGITVTTVLWILPPALRGLVIGLGVRQIPEGRRIGIYFFVCVAAALLTSGLNTLVYYVDSKLMGYYNYDLIFGVFFLRLVTGVLSAILTAAVALPVLRALKKTNLFGERNRA